MAHKWTFVIILFFFFYSTQMFFFFLHLLCVSYFTVSLVGIQGRREHVGNAFASFLPCFHAARTPALPNCVLPPFDYPIWSLFLDSVSSDVFSNVLCFFLTRAHSVASNVIPISEAAVRVNELIH